MYQNIIQSGVDIQAKFREFLIDFVDDGYPTITTKEARIRVSEAVENNKNQIVVLDIFKWINK